MARSALTVVRIHTDSAASAWLSRVSVTEAPTINENPYITPLGDPSERHKPATRCAHTLLFFPVIYPYNTEKSLSSRSAVSLAAARKDACGRI